jgi:hypothetical protein
MPKVADATLYVWSRKEVIPSDMGTTLRQGLERGYGAGVGPDEYETHLVLPEDQQAAVELVQRFASERRLTVELVDLGRARHVLDRRKAHEMGWSEFPVLVSPEGSALVGSASFTEQAVSEALGRTGPPAR